MANQESILQQAKSGDIQAVTVLLNKSLTAKGITIVKCDLKDSCLTLVLESDQSFNSATQAKIVGFIEKNLLKLKISGINQVIISGKLKKEDHESWQKEFRLIPDFEDLPIQDYRDFSAKTIKKTASLVKNNQSKEINIKDSAKSGNISAIKTLLDLALSYKNITTEVSLENKCLRIVLEFANLSDKESCITTIQKQLDYIKIRGINQVNVYIKNDLIWKQDYLLKSNLEMGKKNNYSENKLITWFKKQWSIPSARITFIAIAVIIYLILIGIFVWYNDNTNIIEDGVRVLAGTLQVTIIVGFFVGIIKILNEIGTSGIKKEQKQIKIKQEYENIKNQLSQEPNNIHLRQLALQTARKYYASFRSNGRLTIYDEQAIQNDLSAIFYLGFIQSNPQKYDQYDHYKENIDCSDSMTKLEKLNQLKDKNLITEADFEGKKQQILDDL